MVDMDDKKFSYEESTATSNRDDGIPVSGLRETFGQMVFSSACPEFGNDKDDRSLQAYSVCAIELTNIEFAFNRGEPIEMYVNHPHKIYSFIETCEIADRKRCFTDVLEPGLDYIFYPSDKYAIRLVFENDSEENLIFQIEYKGVRVDLLGGIQTLSTVGLASALAIASFLSF